MHAAVAPARLSRESEFLSRYDQLLKWAQRLTQEDRSLAEDVVHDAYLQFVLSRTDHSSINNLDHYLHQVVRNAHRTYIRQTTPRRFDQLSSVDLDSMQIAAIDPDGPAQARQLLFAVCVYACDQRELSIAFSVLVLRFIHGYYPNEVARLTKRTRGAVDGFLKSARNALKIHLSDLRPCYFSEPHEALRASLSHGATDIFGLQRILFASRKGVCLESEEVRSIYLKRAAKMTRRQLSHLVTCATCLDEANAILGIVSLRERSPIDVLGKIPKTVQLLLPIIQVLIVWGLYALTQANFDFDDIVDCFQDLCNF